MVRALTGLIVVVMGCYQPPDDLRGLDTEVPLVGTGACAPNRHEFVSCTIDGDTFDVNGCGDEVGERVRMLGIDAPETEKPGVPADCGANEAWEELTRVIDGDDVWLTFDEECLDQYDRTLAYVWAGDVSGQGPGADALFVNEWLLTEGFVRYYEFGDRLRLADRLEAAEADAKARGIGVWATCGAGQ